MKTSQKTCFLKKITFITNFLCLETPFSSPTERISAWCHNENTRSSKLQRQNQTAAFRVFSSESLQALKEHLEDCSKNFFSARKFDRLHAYLFQLFSLQLKDQVYSDCLVNTLLLHLSIQNHSLNISNIKNDIDALEMKKEIIKVFTQTEFYPSPNTEVPLQQKLSTIHRIFSYPETFLNQPTTHYSSLMFEADDEFSSVNIDSLHVDYAHTDYLSS